MPVERRGQAIVFEIGSTGDGKNPIINGRRQPSRGGTSRMNREVHVRFCEGLGVKFPGLFAIFNRRAPSPLTAAYPQIASMPDGEVNESLSEDRPRLRIGVVVDL